jgi:hypothetical protein
MVTRRASLAERYRQRHPQARGAAHSVLLDYLPKVIDTKDLDALGKSWKQSRGSGDERRARVRQRGNRKGLPRSFD